MASKDIYPKLISWVRTSSSPTRIKSHGILILSLVLVTFSVPSLADWDAGLEGGAVIRNGEQSSRLRFSLNNATRPLSHYLYADWILNSGDDSYEAGYRPRYWFNANLYALGELTFRTDKPIGIDRETTQTLGVGYQLLSTPTQSAFVELAAGARQLVFSQVGLEDVNQPFTRARASYQQTLSDIARFSLNTTGNFSDAVTETQADIGVTFYLNTLAVTVGYRVIQQRIDGQPAITDDTTGIAFNYRL